MKKQIATLLCLASLAAYGQDQGKYIKDARTGCMIWDEYYTPQDSISWEGPCEKGYAEGKGVLVWYAGGQEAARYTGVMKKGVANGYGKYAFVGNGAIEGNFTNGVLKGKGKTTFANGHVVKGQFIDGAFISIDAPSLAQLQKNSTSFEDSSDIYVNDDSKLLFYYSVAPQGVLKGTLVLLPSSGETAESVLSCNKKLIELASQNKILTIVPTVNNDKGLDHDLLALHFLNAVFSEVISKFHAPENKIVLGGFSGGGMIALRYTEMANDGSGRTSIKPVAVLGVDPPVDIAGLYKKSERDVFINKDRKDLSQGKQNGLRESRWIMEEYNKRYGGSPDQYPERYVQASMFSRSEVDAGNAKHLKNVPVRLYSDPDIQWAMKERNRDYYDMNASDESAMINFLNMIGNKNAEFITALGKGYRLDGTRHPHSWSIVDAEDCVKWVLRWIK